MDVIFFFRLKFIVILWIGCITYFTRYDALFYLIRKTFIWKIIELPYNWTLERSYLPVFNNKIPQERGLILL